MYIILKSELKFITKEAARVLSIMIIGLILIIAMILIKYKPRYEVTIAGENVGYIKDVAELNELIDKKILNQDGKNIDNVTLKSNPTYELKLINKNIETNEDEIISKIAENNTVIIYKYYKVALNNENQALVNTLEEAEEIVNNIKSEYNGNDLELDLQVIEEYTENTFDVKTDTVEVATSNVENVVESIKDEKESENALAIVNGIDLATLPVNGMITSRYGEVSSRRSSTHTGLDIACSKGTPIKATASGTVTFAKYNGSYGNLIKIDHGNGVETWYGHCSKIYAKVGDKIDAGDTIAAVGSTGNSTGSHLHFEIRINGNTVNPQKYLY